jgi:hypothetical protein
MTAETLGFPPFVCECFVGWIASKGYGDTVYGRDDEVSARVEAQ